QLPRQPPIQFEATCACLPPRSIHSSNFFLCSAQLKPHSSTSSSGDTLYCFFPSSNHPLRQNTTHTFALSIIQINPFRPSGGFHQPIMDAINHHVEDGPTTSIQKRKRHEIADNQQKRHKAASDTSSDNITAVDFAKMNKSFNQAGPITNTEPRKDDAVEQIPQEEKGDSSEELSSVLGEEPSVSVKAAPSQSSSHGSAQHGDKKKKRKQQAKPVYTAGNPSVSFVQKKSVSEAGSLVQADPVQEADESGMPVTLSLFSHVIKDGSPPRRRCPETETLVLDWEEAMFTAEIPFDVMDDMLKHIGDAQWTGSGSKWLKKYEKVTQLDQRFQQHDPTSQLGQHLLHILDICSRYQHRHYAAEQIELIGDLNSNDETVIAGQVHLIESRVLPSIGLKAKKSELVHHIIPLAVAAAFAIFLSGEDLEGPRIYHSMASLKVLRQLVGVISELAMLIGPNGDELATLCAVLTEDIAKTLDNIGVQVVNERKAVAAEKAAEAEAKAKKAAIQHRKAQFFASAERFLEQGHTKRPHHEELAIRGSSVASALSTSPSEASWWAA
ncbi:hypothetical protein F5X68DRAFT_21738, partial [Plectosphaerella plurivora]